MNHLINRSAIKKFIIQRFTEMRAGRPMTRVSKEYLDKLDFYIRNKIENDIQSHPSIGTTFKP